MFYNIFYHVRAFNKSAATLVRPHPFFTLYTTPLVGVTEQNVNSELKTQVTHDQMVDIAQDTTTRPARDCTFSGAAFPHHPSGTS